MVTHNDNPNFKRIDDTPHIWVALYRPQRSLRASWVPIEALLPQWPGARSFLEMYLPKKLHFVVGANDGTVADIDHTWASAFVSSCPPEAKEAAAELLGDAIQRITDELKAIPMGSIFRDGELVTLMAIAQADMRLQELAQHCREHNFPTLVEILEHQLGVRRFPWAHTLQVPSDVSDIMRRAAS